MSRLPLVAMAVTRPGCSICSKTMMSLHGTNGLIDEETGKEQIELFQKPLFQTFGMFVGMCLCESCGCFVLLPLTSHLYP